MAVKEGYMKSLFPLGMIIILCVSLINVKDCGASRTSSVEQLSAMDLRNQSQNRAFHSVNGLVNPLWQFPCACQSARIISASQQSLNYVHCHPVHPCQHIYAQQLPTFNNRDSNNPHVTSDPVSFQYSTPQLVSPPDSRT